MLEDTMFTCATVPIR
ncbi:hypothetical protein AB0953_30945 [Streptomyces sp. NPDC046866]